MGLRKKSYEDQLDQELEDKFGDGTGKKSKGKSKKSKSKASAPSYPKPEYDNPWIAKAKIFVMFLFLFFIVIGIALVVIYALGISSYSWTWLIIIGIFLLIFNVVVYFISDKVVLKTYNAKIIKEKDNPRLFNIVKDVSMRANLPMPKVAVIPTSTPNAFATGRNPDNAVVAATEGIMDILDDEELEGVIAHECAHVKNRDILVMTVASTAAMFIAFAARIIFFQMLFGRGRGNVNPIILVVALITAPIAAFMIQYAISRSREYKADRIGAITIQKPLALASALEKLEKGNKIRPMRKGDPATSSLFIVNPFSSGSFASLFSTHPPMKERIKRLRKMAETYSYL